ncbi:hypothetical protein BH23CHL1_BH23CHL1_15080 [soil metagenome]
MSADAASAQTQPATHLETTLSGRALGLARAGWVTLVALALTVFATSLVARYLQVSNPATGGVVLPDVGLSRGVYAVYLTTVNAVFGLGCLAIAALIARGRSNGIMALFVSLFLVFLGAANAPNMQALSDLDSRMTLPANLALFGGWTGMILFLLLFPDGRFVPQWMRAVAIAWIASLAAATALTGDFLARPASASTSLLILGGLATGAGLQIYRYFRVANPVERQQTKWVVFGIMSTITIQIGTAVLEQVITGSNRLGAWHDLVEVTFVTFGYLFIPLTIGIAILRYRLWDIDIIINRALVYGLLTASVVGVYILAVGGIGTLFQTRSNLGISLLATGLVAVLFQPLRERFQRGVNHIMYGERDEPYAVLSRLGQRLEETLAPDTVLPAVVETVRDALRLPYTAVALYQDDELNVVAESGARVKEVQYLPLIYQGETVGELLLGRRPGEDAFAKTDLRLLDDLARQAGVAAHGVRLTADLQRSRERLVNAREEERRRLRRDLHDGLGPQLASQTLTIDAVVKLLRDDPETAAELLQDLKAQSQTAVSDIRRLVYDLRPPALDDLGLIGALRSQADAYRHTSLEISISAPQPLPELPAAVEVACYRITQEALMNAVRHAQARHCGVSLAIVDATLRLEIRDDGQGLPEHCRSGVGLHSMKERAAELGGSCLIESCTGSGTRVFAELPLRLEE